MPLFVFVFLVALGIDYNIFLMTRVHEESKRYGTRRGALIGLGATGGVITSAGAVLAGTFAVLGTLPLVFLAELGFAVAFGVLLDTIVVRSVLVTALNLDIGRHIWWPSKLAQKADVEPGRAARRAPGRPDRGDADLDLGRPRSGQGASRNGGYWSVTSSSAYARTRLCHRITPSTKRNIPLGYRPVKRMANQATITTTTAAMSRKNSTM